MRLFVVASAALLVAAALLLGSMLTRTLHSQALGEERTSLAQYVDGVLGPVVVHDDNVVTTRRLSQTILRVLRGQPDVVSVKVWRGDGTLAWTSLDASRLGRRFPLDSDLGEAIRGDRESQRHRRGARPVHGRPFAARGGDRARDRRSAPPAAHPAGGAPPRGPLPRHRQAARARRRADEARPAHG